MQNVAIELLRDEEEILFVPPDVVGLFLADDKLILKRIATVERPSDQIKQRIPDFDKLVSIKRFTHGFSFVAVYFSTDEVSCRLMLE